MTATVTLVHDYLTQRGGAERVVLSMIAAFPGAPLHTSLYEPTLTFPAFERADVRPLPLNRIAALRRRHRLALPLLAPSFARLSVPGDVVLCSSSGWAHGVRTDGRKIVYCYTPARWLYQTGRYLGGGRGWVRPAMAMLIPPLVRWDRRSARSAHRYLTLSTAVRDRIRAGYGIDADILPPPHTLDPTGPQRPIPGIGGDFLLCVSRLLPYKNVGAIIEAAARRPRCRLVVAGTGPDRSRLERSLPANVRLAGRLDDAELRWAYANCRALVAASHEDYGLTPLEAASFGKPSVVLAWGGFLDTMVGGVTGIFFPQPTPEAIATAIDEALSHDFDAAAIRRHADAFSETRFVERLRAVVSDEARRGG